MRGERVKRTTGGNGGGCALDVGTGTVGDGEGIEPRSETECDAAPAPDHCGERGRRRGKTWGEMLG